MDRCGAAGDRGPHRNLDAIRPERADALSDRKSRRRHLTNPGTAFAETSVPVDACARPKAARDGRPYPLLNWRLRFPTSAADPGPSAGRCVVAIYELGQRFGKEVEGPVGTGGVRRG